MLKFAKKHNKWLWSLVKYLRHFLIPVIVVFYHRIEAGKLLPHTCDKGYFFWFTSSDQALIHWL